MRFGLFGSASARRGGAEFDSSEGFRDFIDYNVEAEALGFHSTFVVEHHFTGYGQVSATLNLLTWVGARTRRLRLGTAVMVLPWHNPVLLAEQAATLDLLSGGRLDFGIGKGYRYNEFAGFRMSMEEADARFEECLEVLVKAWTADEPFSHRGKYWEFDNIVVEPPPAQKPHPQIWMGAGSERSIRQVAAQGFKPRRTILIVSGNNEEVMRPNNGARIAAETLKARGVTALFALDEGSATLITGGKVPDLQSVAPYELRGSHIEGGEVRTIGPGDVVVVPSGTPHWFRDVQGPVLYFAVKVAGDGVAQ